MLFQPQALPTVKSVTVDQYLLIAESVAKSRCIELGEFPDKWHCCVTGELNVSLGVVYHTTGLLRAETDP